MQNTIDFLKRISLFNLVSAIVGAFSLFSMMEEVWQFGISSVIEDFLKYYRTLAQWVFGWIGWPTTWRLPALLRDLLALQLLCSGILLRSGAIRDLMTRSIDDRFKPAGRFSKSVLLLTPLSILACYSALNGIFTNAFNESEESTSLNRQVAPFVYSSIFVLAVIFALNAYGLSATSL